MLEAYYISLLRVPSPNKLGRGGMGEEANAAGPNEHIENCFFSSQC